MLGAVIALLQEYACAFCGGVTKAAHEMTTEDIRDYLAGYSQDSRAGKATVDNVSV